MIGRADWGLCIGMAGGLVMPTISADAGTGKAACVGKLRGAHWSRLMIGL